MTFRYVPPGREASEVDGFNQRLVAAMYAEGFAIATTTVVHDCTVLASARSTRGRQKLIYGKRSTTSTALPASSVDDVLQQADRMGWRPNVNYRSPDVKIPFSGR